MAIAIAACGSEPAPEAGSEPLSSGTFALDPSHTTVTFYYLHQGLSYPLLRATGVAGELEFNPAEVESSSVKVAIAADSIRSNIDYFDDELASRKFFNAERYPHITFSSERYEATGENEGIVHGQVTIRGISKPLALNVRLNGKAEHPMTGIPVIGFSATGTLNRSDFGLDRAIPVVADQVDFRIETEFIEGSNDSSQAAVIAADQALVGS